MTGSPRGTLAFAALVFFVTCTLFLAVLLWRDPLDGGLTAEERVNVEVYRGASPSVVHLTTVTSPFFDPSDSDGEGTSGSGVVWNERGYLVTNDHLVFGQSEGAVAFPDGTKWRTIMVGVDEEHDVAVLFALAPVEKLVPLARGSSRDLLVGQRVFAIGNPFSLEQTLTVGVISGLGRSIEGYSGKTMKDMIQTDAAVNPGNSGGPLLDTSGRLVGINTAIPDSSATNAGVGFALPVDALTEVVPRLIREGLEPWPEIGLILFPDEFNAEALRGWQNDEGLTSGLLFQVDTGSVALEAGMRGTLLLPDRAFWGDIVVGVDGRAFETREELSEVLAGKRPGDVLVFDVMRGIPASRMQVRLVWGERSSSPL